MTLLEHHIERRWIWLIGILLLALVLRLLWIQDAGFTHDVSFFVRWMRLAAESGIGQVFATAKSSYPPLSVYLLGILGWVSPTGALNAPPTQVELLVLRATTITFDLLTIAVLYALGRRISSRKAATWAALLYALCPGGIYLSGWWVQIDAWFVLPLLLGAWWLTQERMVLSWVALGLAVALKLQAAVVLPVFAVGTWRWWGLRRLAIGCITLILTLGVITAPLLLSGQVPNLLSKITQPTRYFQWITLESHNLWFALTPHARDLGEDNNRDLNAFVGGVSFRDVGLALLALGYGLILVRLFVRSGPGSIFTACAVTWLVFFMLPTRIDARYLFPALALMLCAGFYQRRWWILYAVAAVTLLINLVWKSRAISPLMSLLPITLEGAVVNAWINLAILGVALTFYVTPLLNPSYYQANLEGTLRRVERGWEMALLGVVVTVSLGALVSVFGRGRNVGAQIAQLQPPLRASLDASLGKAGRLEKIVIVNWPRAISADSSVYLGGIIPVTPPTLFLAPPDAVNRDATWVQYPPWQQTTGLEIEYHGTHVTQAELATLVQQAQQVVTFSPEIQQMVVSVQDCSPIMPLTCLASFDQRACLVTAQATWQESMLQIELMWQVTGTLLTDETVFVHIVDTHGNLVVQADGDLAGGLLPLASLSDQNKAVCETRLASVPAGDYCVRIGIYNRSSGERLKAHCKPPHVCPDNAIQIVPFNSEPQ